jgi:dTDP-4-dehydrorhamnose reductase
MKILVTGSAGMLGSTLCPILIRRGQEVIATDFAQTHDGIHMDVTDYIQVDEIVSKTKPDIILHLAAETDVDKCEREPDHAFLMNTIGTQNVALVCQKRNTTMVYISTTGVFDGNKSEPYIESDPPNPINVYGRSKFEGEKIVQSLLKRYFILRAGWMFGGGPEKDKKFVGKIIMMMNNTNMLKVVNDKTGSLTYTVDFSRCLAGLIETNNYGLYHCTNKGYCSRFDVAKRIIEFLDKSNVTVEPVSSACFPSSAARPNFDWARNQKLEFLGKDSMRNWEDALKEYLNSYWKPNRST